MILSTAIFSDCRRYRYDLMRRWNTEGRKIVFIGLNPSTADEETNDPTVTRCMRWAYRWSYSEMHMLNIFAYRSTDPKQLDKVIDPVGSETDRYISQECEDAETVICCWGNWGKYLDRGQEARYLLNHLELWCFDITKLGQPKHPLYLPNGIIPRRFV